MKVDPAAHFAGEIPPNDVASTRNNKIIYETSHALLPASSTCNDCFAALAAQAELKLAGEQKGAITKKNLWRLVKWLGGGHRPFVLGPFVLGVCRRFEMPDA